MSPLKKTLIILLLFPLLILYSGWTMFGPQIFLTLLIAIGTGVYFIKKRSAYAFICFGFPLFFGFISAALGQTEMKNYITTTGFLVSILIGLTGLSLVAIGLWKIVSEKNWPYLFIFLGSPLSLFLILLVFHIKSIDLTRSPVLGMLGLGVGGLILASIGLWKILTAKVAGK